MIASFVDSWALFSATYLAGLFLAAALALTGVFSALKNQFFVGASIANSSALGALAGVVVFTAFGPNDGAHAGHAGHGSDMWFAYLGAGLAAAAASLGVAWFVGARRPGGYEALNSWIFAMAASLTGILAARRGGGLDEAEQLFSGNIIGASGAEAWLFLALLCAAIVVTLLCGRALAQVSLDPDFAASAGVSRRAWELFGAAWLGITVGLSIRYAGMLFAFAFLALPALAARNLARSLAQMFWLAPLLAATAAFAGFFLANGLDLPLSQTATACMGGAVVIASGIGRLSRSRFPAE